MKHASNWFSTNRVAASFGTFVMLSALGLSTSAKAHHPDWDTKPVYPMIDVIGPKGNNLKPSYRRRYNRPRYVTGKLLYHIAPSSQEAMAWHRAVHADAYKAPKKHCRLEQHYFYPKPWEVLTVGPRTAKDEGEVEQRDPDSLREMLDSDPIRAPEPQPDSSYDLPLIESE